MQIFYSPQFENIKDLIDERCRFYVQHGPVDEVLLNWIERDISQILKQACLPLDFYVYAREEDIYIVSVNEIPIEETNMCKCQCGNKYPAKDEMDLNISLPYEEINDLGEVTWTYSDSTGKEIPLSDMVEPEEKTDLEILAEVIDLLDQLVCHEDIMRVLKTAKVWFKEN